MKAAWYENNGEARDVMVVGDMPCPDVGPGEVKVKIHVSGVNPSDVKSRRARPLGTNRVIPNSDAAGTIEAVGAGVPETRVGQRVWIWNGQFGRALGTSAQYIVLPTAQAVVLPDNTDFDAGACMGIPGLTALEAVHRCGDLAGKTVLIIGAASSVSHYAAQMAVQKGAHVIGTVSSVVKAAHASAAGVSDIINFKTEDVAERIKQLTHGQGVDAIIDMDFSTTSQLIHKGALKAHGTVVCFGSNQLGDHAIPFRISLFGSLSYQFFLVYDLSPARRLDALEELNELLAAGKLKHTIGARYPLSDIVAAHEAVEQGSIMGNIVIDLD